MNPQEQEQPEVMPLSGCRQAREVGTQCDEDPYPVAAQTQCARIVRSVAFTSFLGIAFAAVILSYEFRRITVEELKSSVEANNVALTQSLANALWQQFSPLLVSRGLDGGRNEELESLHQEVVRQLGNLPAVKVKLYDLSGRTVFSTEFRQIGQDMSNNPGFQAARSGRVVSELTHQDSLSYFDREIIRDRDLYSSYVPLRRPGNSQEIEAIFEVYTDITADLQKIRAAQLHMVSVTIIVHVVLYLALLLLVRRANHIILQQQELHKILQDRIRHLSRHDLLTRLPNRGELLRHLQTRLAVDDKPATPFALMIVVIDNLKQINNLLGHSSGDRVLQEMSDLIRSLVGDGVFCAYYSDGKFAICLESDDITNHAFVKARQLLDAGRRPLDQHDVDMHAELSIGISLHPKDSEDADVLIRQALAAADEARRAGPYHVRFYRPDTAAPATLYLGDAPQEIAPA